jgi:predicted nucleic acid-binding protein
MRIDRVVVNASPLICLSKSGLSQLLSELFSEIVVCDEVYQEITAKSGVDPSSMRHINRVGNIKSIRDSLMKLQNAGLWLSETFIAETCRLAGE